MRCKCNWALMAPAAGSMGMSELSKRIADLSPAKRELLFRRLRRNQADLPAPSAMSVEELNARAVLDPAIDPASASAPSASAAATLLTGATGFLGGFLLHELLQQTNTIVYCLVRGASTEEAAERLAENLAALRLPSQHLGGRIVPVAGDLALPLLGLGQRQFEEFAGQIDVIHHCGAAVRWTYPYRARAGSEHLWHPRNSPAGQHVQIEAGSFHFDRGSLLVTPLPPRSRPGIGRA